MIVQVFYELTKVVISFEDDTGALCTVKLSPDEALGLVGGLMATVPTVKRNLESIRINRLSEQAQEFEEILSDFTPEQQVRLRTMWEGVETKQQAESFVGLLSIHSFEQGTDDQRPFGDLILELEEMC